LLKFCVVLFVFVDSNILVLYNSVRKDKLADESNTAGWFSCWIVNRAATLLQAIWITFQTWCCVPIIRHAVSFFIFL